MHIYWNANDNAPKSTTSRKPSVSMRYSHQCKLRILLQLGQIKIYAWFARNFSGDSLSFFGNMGIYFLFPFTVEAGGIIFKLL